MSETLIGVVPDEWLVTTLGELCAQGGGDIQTGPFGSQLHASDYVASGIPSVMPQNIGDNVINEDGIARITQEDADRLNRYLLRSGDIVYSRRGDVERRAWVRADQTGWLCGTGCLRVRLGDSADSRFLSYYLGHPGVRAWIVQHAIGATMPNLNTGILSTVPAVIPPTSEQTAIAALLGALDDKIAVNDRIACAAFDLADARYVEITTNAVGSASLGDLIELKYGKALPSGDRTEGKFPVYGSGGVTGTHDKPLVEGPGIIVGRKGTVGAVYWSEQNFFPIDTTFYVTLRRDEVPMEFAFHMLRHLGLDGMNSDSAVPGLNRGNALAVQVKLPDHEGLRRYHQEARPLFTLRESLSVQSASLAELRDRLLPKLMSGQIRVRDAEKVVEDVT